MPRYELYDPSDNASRVVIPDGCTTKDVEWVCRVIAIRDPQWWKRWRVHAYENGEESVLTLAELRSTSGPGWPD